MQQTGAKPWDESPIKIFRAAAGESSPEDDGPLSANLTLCEFWRRYVRPICYQAEGRAPDTLKQIEMSLTNYWQPATGDPPLAQIDEATCAKFSQYLRAAKYQGRALSTRTIIKQTVHVQTVLDRAGPSDDRKKKCAALLGQTPYISRPRPAKRVNGAARHAFSVGEIEALLSAAGEMVTPRLDAPLDRLLPPDRWWRSLVLLAYLTGLRISELMLWRWDWIDRGGETLVIPGGAADVRWRAKGRDDQAIYLSQAARDVLRSLDLPGKTERGGC